MCPACINTYATAATLIAGIASSTGGIAAIVIKKIRTKIPKSKENPNGK
jgi:hypothetical protein